MAEGHWITKKPLDPTMALAMKLLLRIAANLVRDESDFAHQQGALLTRVRDIMYEHITISYPDNDANDLISAIDSLRVMEKMIYDESRNPS